MQDVIMSAEDLNEVVPETPKELTPEEKKKEKEEQLAFARAKAEYKKNIEAQIDYYTPQVKLNELEARDAKADFEKYQYSVLLFQLKAKVAESNNQDDPAKVVESVDNGQENSVSTYESQHTSVEPKPAKVLKLKTTKENAGK